MTELDGFMSELTECRLIGEALRRSETLFKNLFEQHAAVKLIIDPADGKIIDANIAAAEFYGWTRKQLVQMRIQDINTLSSEKIMQEMEKARTHERIHFEFRHRRADGSIRDVEVFSSKIEAEGKELLHSIVHDITTRKKSEAALLDALKQLREANDLLVQTEKMAAMGRLSAGIAHEIINPLSIMSSRLQILEQAQQLPDAVREVHEEIKKQMDRIIRITKNIKLLSNMSALQCVPADLSAFVGDVLTLNASHLCAANVIREVCHEEGLSPVMLDRDRMEQVLWNILANAICAMKDKEKKVISIVTKRVVTQNGVSCVRLIVSDSGDGIRKENKQRIFDPFFTTKRNGEGTGLGLSIAHEIVKNHGGKIWADNNKWGGASFFIELPAVNGQSGVDRQLP
jgi:two-component system, cell cycle sensor histidine kinase and response regulator CckA